MIQRHVFRDSIKIEMALCNTNITHLGRRSQIERERERERERQGQRETERETGVEREGDRETGGERGRGTERDRERERQRERAVGKERDETPGKETTDFPLESGLARLRQHALLSYIRPGSRNRQQGGRGEAEGKPSSGAQQARKGGDPRGREGVLEAFTGSLQRQCGGRCSMCQLASQLTDAH